MAADLYELVFDKEIAVPDPAAAGKGLRFRTKTIKSGNVLEVEIFPVWDTRSIGTWNPDTIQKLYTGESLEE